MLSMLSFFGGFHIGSSDVKIRFYIVMRSNVVRQYVTDLESQVF